MAEITTSDKGNSRKNRSHKQSVKIDMTPMVDLGFLLITFFMLTTTLSTPSAMHLGMPEDVIDTQPVPASKTMTILLDDNNTIRYFIGLPSVSQTKTTDFQHIRSILLANKEQIGKSFFVILKASNQAKYKNLVDVLDEFAITNTQRYAIAAFTPDDKLLISQAR